MSSATIGRHGSEAPIPRREEVPGEAMSVPFEFVIGGPAVSQQTRRTERREVWKEEVRSVARDRWTSDSPVAGSVAVTITYFFESGEPDVDNIPKPILDAMQGVVYSDDTQVSDLLCRKEIWAPFC